MEVIYEFDTFSINTLFLAMYITDKSLAFAEPIVSENLQRVGITAIFIASKYEDVHALRVADAAYLTDASVSVSEITETESIILRQLNYEITVPYIISFVGLFPDIIANRRARTLFEYLAVSCLYNPDLLSTFFPSELAKGCAYLTTAMLSGDVSLIWNITDEKIASIIQTIHLNLKILNTVDKEKYFACASKIYAKEEYYSVARIPLLDLSCYPNNNSESQCINKNEMCF